MQIALTFRNNSWNVKRRLLHTRGSGMCYITRGSLRVDISNISDGGCLIFLYTDATDAHWKVMYRTLLARRKWNSEGWLCVFLNTDFADSADAHWKVMYRTLLVWLSGLLLLYPIEYTYAGLHLRGATRATCGTLRFQWRRTWRIVAALPYWIYVRWFAFARSHTLQATCGTLRFQCGPTLLYRKKAVLFGHGLCCLCRNF